MFRRFLVSADAQQGQAVSGTPDKINNEHRMSIVYRRVVLSIGVIFQPCPWYILVSRNWTSSVKNITSPKVKIAKYMPRSLSVTRPTRRANAKDMRLAITIITGKGNVFCSRAIVYMPRPKNAAGANDM